MKANVEMVKDYIIENMNQDGTFNKRYVDVSNALGLSQNIVRGIMLDIVKKGFLDVLVEPKKGKGSSPIYKLRVHEIKGNEVNPIETYDENNTKIVEFQGVEIVLRLLDGYGYCIDLQDMALCVLEQPITFSKIISSNKELFEDHIFNVDDKILLDRNAVLTLLLKVNIDKVHPVKKNMVIDFNKLIVSVMCDSQLRAKLYITENNRVKIRHNLNCLLNLDAESVEQMLVDLEYQVSKQIEGLQTKTIQQNRQIHKLESETKRLENRVEIEKSAKMLLISQSNELKAKLLERN